MLSNRTPNVDLITKTSTNIKSIKICLKQNRDIRTKEFFNLQLN